MFNIKHLARLILLPILLLIGCEQSDGEGEGDLDTDLYTQDINEAPQFFTFKDASFHQTTYDLTFEIGQMVYLVGLNSAAGVLALATDTLDFDTEALPAIGYAPDSSSMVIGSSWMDISTYNSADHSISSNNMIYFIRSSDYNWFKFKVLSASPDTFKVAYAFWDDEAGYGATQNANIPYATDNPTNFSLSSTQIIEPLYWDICIASTPEYSTELQSNFYMPTFYSNSQVGVQISFQDGLVYEEVLAVPDGTEWMEDTSSRHPFGNGGEHQILVYHPEPPYNHKVLVEMPERIYFVRTTGGDYKLQFKEYSSGIVLFATDAI